MNIVGHEIPPVCILAGGLGSRLGDRVQQTPKPILKVAGEPFLVHQLRLLAGAGVRRVVLCVGYHGEQIEQTIGSEQSGIRISYSYDRAELDGTLGAIRRALPLLGDRFLTLYGDTYLHVDYGAFDSGWLSSGLPAAMAVLHNDGEWGQSNATLLNNLVVRYDKYGLDQAMKWIDYGLGGLTVRALDLVSEEERDLAKLHHMLAQQGLLYGYEAFNRFYEIGTPDSLRETDNFLRGGQHVDHRE